MSATSRITLNIVNCLNNGRKMNIVLGQQTQFANQVTIDILKEAIKLCEEYSNDRYSLYKGRQPYKGNEEGRADNYVEGQSAGADYCVSILEELLEGLNKGEND